MRKRWHLFEINIRSIGILKSLAVGNYNCVVKKSCIDAGNMLQNDKVITWRNSVTESDY